MEKKLGQAGVVGAGNHDTGLAGVPGGESQRCAVGAERWRGAQWVAGRGLHLYDVRAHVGQDAARHGGDLAGQVDDPQSRQKSVVHGLVLASLRELAQEAAFSSTCTAQADPSPMTWVRPTLAPST